MKRIFLKLMVACMAVPSVLGQGTINFWNYPSTSALVRYQIELGSDVLEPVPVHNGRVEILWAPVGTTDLGQFQIVGLSVDVYPVPGRFIGGVRTVPIWNPGGVVDMVVRGWVGPASNWAQAVSGGAHMYGYSAIFTVDTGDPTLVPAGIPTSIANLFPGLDLYFIPEPSPAALVIVGVLIIAIRRNKGAPRELYSQCERSFTIDSELKGRWRWRLWESAASVG